MFHTTLKALRHKNYTLFFTGQTISLVGTWSQGLAISWLVWRLTRSAVWLGIAGFAVQFPILVLGLAGGWVADRFDRHKYLTLMQILCMIQAVLLSILTISGIITLWQVIVLSAALGVIYSFEFPLRLAFIQDMVGKEDLLNAVSLNAAMIHATRMAGPVAAGLIVAWKGEGICFLFNAATFLALITGLLLIDRKKLIFSRHEDKPMWHSIVEGLGHMRREPRTREALFLVAVVSVFGLPFITFLPIFADKVFSGGAIELGWMMGASGLGSLIGALWLSRRRSSKGLLSLTSGTSVFFSVSIALFSFMTELWAALALLAVAGLFLTITFAGINTLLQDSTPDYVRGRVMSMFSTAFLGLAPIGSLIGGFAAHEIGAPLTIAISAVPCAIAGAWIWINARGFDSRHI